MIYGFCLRLIHLFIWASPDLTSWKFTAQLNRVGDNPGHWWEPIIVMLKSKSWSNSHVNQACSDIVFVLWETWFCLGYIWADCIIRTSPSMTRLNFISKKIYRILKLGTVSGLSSWFYAQEGKWLAQGHTACLRLSPENTRNFTGDLFTRPWKGPVLKAKISLASVLVWSVFFLNNPGHYNKLPWIFQQPRMTGGADFKGQSSGNHLLIMQKSQHTT